jgi:hypothetical protein
MVHLPTVISAPALQVKTMPQAERNLTFGLQDIAFCIPTPIIPFAARGRAQAGFYS